MFAQPAGGEQAPAGANRMTARAQGTAAWLGQAVQPRVVYPAWLKGRCLLRDHQHLVESEDGADDARQRVADDANAHGLVRHPRVRVSVDGDAKGADHEGCQQPSPGAEVAAGHPRPGVVGAQNLDALAGGQRNENGERREDKVEQLAFVSASCSSACAACAHHPCRCRGGGSHVTRPSPILSLSA